MAEDRYQRDSELASKINSGTVSTREVFEDMLAEQQGQQAPKVATKPTAGGPFSSRGVKISE